MKRAETKASRLLQIEALLLAHPEGLSQAEIARRVRVDRSTIHRYLPDLSESFPVYETDDGRLCIDRSNYLVNVRLNLHEALAVHLAARLLATRMDRQNPHAAAALRKLGLSLDKLAPRISRHIQQSADVMDEAAQRHDPVYLQALETLTLAWAEQRKAQVWHYHEPTGKVYEYLFSPYFIEPYAVGQTTHIIGFREPPEKMRTFKVERIKRVELTAKPYIIPGDFDPRDLLGDAWSIWYTEAEPVEVVLRFHPRVAQRVKETRWHRSEEIEEQADGHLIWRARVAEPKEMLPWLRGWGGDVEVLKPDNLRSKLMKEAGRLAKMYLSEIMLAKPKHFLLWGKTDQGKDTIHPLLYHMVDVAQVALAIWDEVLTASIRQQFATTLELSGDQAGKLLAFWIGLHDLGKASPSFQSKHKPTVSELEAVGLTFPKSFSKGSVLHGVLSARALEKLLPSETNLARPIARKIARTLGGHHGVWPTPTQLLSSSISQKDTGDESWDAVRRDLVRDMMALYTPPNDFTFPSGQIAENALLTLFSGLTSVADWIGSMEEHFPLEEQYLDLPKYAQRAADQAHNALHTLGWLGWQPTGDQQSFEEMFSDIVEARPIQKEVIEQTKGIQTPCLLILEAPTGIGKTEAALYLADTWLQASGGRGLYVAMPTQATSNQMFGRVIKFLKKRYPDDLVNAHLAHSQARWSKKLQDISLTEIGEERGARVAAMTWFQNNRKRTLLAPFAVGTVDQVLMSVLQTKHFFVRLFGLGHKVVVFDEVHAYDTYMSTLFHRLLSWLRAVGTSVIILSATLPHETRRELMAAYLGTKDLVLPEVSYPRLTCVTSEGVGVFPLPAPEERDLELEWISKDPQEIADRLADELQSGGCAAVICNTVRRSQEVYQAIKDAGIVEEDNLILFHARFPAAWRKEIEDQVLERFSKDGKRPEKAIVVATQVIEQSLDLDFDLMVTDLAPVDLVLQRAGRLHRHPGTPRPDRLASPRLVITTPEIKDGLPDFGRDSYVYEKYFLLRTYLALQGKDRLQVIGQTTDLIEAIYGKEEFQAEKKMMKTVQQAREDMQAQKSTDDAKAKSRLVPTPNDEDLLDETYRALEEDNPEIHQAFQAMTRLIEPGISLICLHQMERGISLEPEGEDNLVRITIEPSFKEIDLLIQHAVTIRDKRILYYLLSHESHQLPRAWERVAALRHYRLAVFQGGVYELAEIPYTLYLSRELGLIVQEKEKK